MESQQFDHRSFVAEIAVMIAVILIYIAIILFLIVPEVLRAYRALRLPETSTKVCSTQKVCLHHLLHSMSRFEILKQEISQHAEAISLFKNIRSSHFTSTCSHTSSLQCQVSGCKSTSIQFQTSPFEHECMQAYFKVLAPPQKNIYRVRVAGSLLLAGLLLRK